MQPACRSWQRALICALALGATAVRPGEADAASTGAVRVEVSTQATDPEPRLAQRFEQVVRAELDRVSLPELPRGQGYVLSAALVELDTRADQQLATTSCRVNFALRRERSGDVTAVLRGRARVSDAKARAAETRSLAMEAAVHSALARLDRALR